MAETCFLAKNNFIGLDFIDRKDRANVMTPEYTTQDISQLLIFT